MKAEINNISNNAMHVQENDASAMDSHVGNEPLNKGAPAVFNEVQRNIWEAKWPFS